MAVSNMVGEVICAFGTEAQKRLYVPRLTSGEFAAGSPERNALSQIDTGSQTPAPEALEINTAVVEAPDKVVFTYVAGGGDHATSFKLKWKIEGVDADFTHETVLNLAGQTVTLANAAGKTVSFKAVATNSTGSTDSAVKTVVMP